MPSIERLVQELDVAVSDITELRVFHLKNADPLDMADIFVELFPDESTSRNSNQNQNGFQFGGFRGVGGGAFGNNNNRNGGQSAGSERSKKKGRVSAVPDQRTSSLIVSAASELMPQIAEMIARLDVPAKKQKVFVYSLENADVGQVEQILRDMFDRSGTSSRNSQNQNSALQSRSQNNQQGSTTSGGVGNNSGFGGGGGGAGGGQGFR